LSTVCRYVERNAVRVGLAEASEDWPWSSAGQNRLDAELRLTLEKHPALRRADWREWVNRPQTAAEEAAMLRCIRESRPFGEKNGLKTTGKKQAGASRCNAAGPGRKNAGTAANKFRAVRAPCKGVVFQRVRVPPGEVDCSTR